jgi:hypothetical protein
MRVPFRHAQGPRPRHPLGKWFPDIILGSSVVQLHDTLRRYYRGIRSSPAAMKIMLAISVFGNLPRFARVVSGHHHDLVFFPRLRDFLKGTLWLFDKGFLDHKRLGRIAKAKQFYLCPTRKNANPFVIDISRIIHESSIAA